MWRKFRYYLRKKFPENRIEIEKVDSFNYRVLLPDLQITVFFGYSNYLKSDETSFKVLMDSLTSNIKNQLFQRQKIKNKR